MLQQTQTSRVVEPWRRFLELFPTPSRCADAPLSAVLTAWTGLGYPRRAKALHAAARVIRDDFGGVVPSDVASLRAACRASASTPRTRWRRSPSHRPVAVLDTNVGRVLARALANRTLGPQRSASAGGVADASARLGRFQSGHARPRRAVLSRRAALRRLPRAGQCAWRREGGEDPAPQSAAVSRAQTRVRRDPIASCADACFARSPRRREPCGNSRAS